MGLKDYWNKKKSERAYFRSVKSKESAEKRAVDREIQAKAESAARSERTKQAVSTAVYKEKLKGEKKREFVKGGGFAGMIQRGYNASASPVRMVSGKRTAKVKGRKKKKRVGKRKVKRKRTNKKRTVSKMINLDDARIF